MKNSAEVLLCVTLYPCLLQAQHHGSGIVHADSLKYDKEGQSEGSRISSSKSKEEVL